MAKNSSATILAGSQDMYQAEAEMCQEICRRCLEGLGTGMVPNEVGPYDCGKWSDNNH